MRYRYRYWHCVTPQIPLYIMHYCLSWFQEIRGWGNIKFNMKKIAFYNWLNKNSFLAGLSGPFSMPLRTSFEIHIKHIQWISTSNDGLNVAGYL